MARILFIHNNFPGQFIHIAKALAERGDQCQAISSVTGRALPQIPISKWSTRRGSTAGIFQPATRAEADMLRGSASAGIAALIRQQGFAPDLVIAHPGWGESLFIDEIFPSARQVLYGEFYYGTSGTDVDFDPEYANMNLHEAIRIKAKNATGALAYMSADAIVSPTAFQASLFPSLLRDRIRVIHEGIDTSTIRPEPRLQSIRLTDGTVIKAGDPLVTFVNRRFEPMRGFHTFMRALPMFQANVPTGRVVLIGADEAGGYGGTAGHGTTWKARLLSELGDRIDPGRVHFTGVLSNADMHALMRLGRAHVYLTYPFTLSWSLFEAMALGCLVIGSGNRPVTDLIEHERNGILVDMLNPEALASVLTDVCRRPCDHYSSLRAAARTTVVDGFDLQRVCLPRWLALVDEMLAS